MLNSILLGVIKTFPEYRNARENANRNEYLPLDDIWRENDRKLAALIRYCYKRVPYYRDLFDRLKLKPEDVSRASDLSKLPFMDKKTVRENYDALIAKGIGRYLARPVETSGTTGFPSKFLRDIRNIAYESIFLDRFRNNAGFTGGAGTVVLRGERVCDADCRTPPFWKYDKAGNNLIMSCFHLNRETFGAYAAEIEKFRPDALYAYPTLAAQLADYYLEAGKKPGFRLVLTSSETLSSLYREKIETAFGCGVFDWYGQVERVCAIGQCPSGKYHIIEDYSIAEVVETSHGTELVGTCLNNFVMPLIRYRTNDFVELDRETCSCGRKHRVVGKLYGRDFGYVYSSSGDTFSYFLISDSIDVRDHISEVQFVQEQPGKLILNAVCDEHYEPEDGIRIASKIRKLTSWDMEIEIRQVDAIPRMENGKVKNLQNMELS